MVCTACTEDETIALEAKEKLWFPWKLKEHISSNVHSVRMRFLRHIKKEAEAANRATFVCPYCRLLSEEYQAGTIPTPVQHFADTKSVMRHVENSDRDKIVSSTKDKLK